MYIYFLNSIIVGWLDACEATGTLGLVGSIFSIGLMLWFMCTYRESMWLKIAIISMEILACKKIV